MAVELDRQIPAAQVDIMSTIDTEQGAAGVAQVGATAQRTLYYFRRPRQMKVSRAVLITIQMATTLRGAGVEPVNAAATLVSLQTPEEVAQAWLVI